MLTNTLSLLPIKHPPILSLANSEKLMVNTFFLFPESPRRFAELNGFKKYTEFQDYFDEDLPIVIGEKSSTPYHLFYWTKNGVVLELQSLPTLAQNEKLNQMAERFSERTGIPVNLKVKEQEGSLPKTEEAAAAAEIKTRLGVELNYLQTNGHQISLTEGSRLETFSLPRPDRLPIVYGYGYIDFQLEVPPIEEGSVQNLTIFLDPSARNHEQARSGYLLNKISSG